MAIVTCATVCGMTASSNLTLGAEVRAARAARDLSREALAAEVDVSVSTVARLENLGALPNPRALAAIAKRLGLSLDDLLFRDEQAAS